VLFQFSSHFLFLFFVWLLPVIAGLSSHQVMQGLDSSGLPKSSLELLLARLEASPETVVSSKGTNLRDLLKKVELLRKRHSLVSGEKIEQALRKEVAKMGQEMAMPMDQDTPSSLLSTPAHQAAPKGPYEEQLSLLGELRNHRGMPKALRTQLLKADKSKLETLLPLVSLASAFPAPSSSLKENQQLWSEISRVSPVASKMLKGVLDSRPVTTQPPEITTLSATGEECVTLLRAGLYPSSHLDLRQIALYFARSPFLEEILSLVILLKITSTSASASTLELSQALKDLLTTDDPRSEALHGLCMDWHEMINIGVIRLQGTRVSAPEFDFAFSKVDRLRRKSLVNVRRHILNTLLHDGSWLLLETCLATLLRKASSTSELRDLDPTTALDFITAFLRHPRSWNRLSESLHPLHIQEDAAAGRYRLVSPKEACGIVALIAEEMTLGGHHSHQRVFESRLPLVSYLVDQSRPMLKVISLSLFNQASHGSGESALGSQFALTQLYHLHPDLLSYFPYPEVVVGLVVGFSTGQPQLLTSSTGRSEVHLHRLLTKMFETSTEVSKNKARGAHILLRRFATLHPVAVLKCLPTMAELLQGKALLSASELTQKHHHALFREVLNLLEALQPLVFDKIFFPSLAQVLDCYITMLQNIREYNKGLVGLLGKLTEFLCVCYGSATDHTLQSQYVEGKREVFA